jgi:hypothetical protein
MELYDDDENRSLSPNLDSSQNMNTNGNINTNTNVNRENENLNSNNSSNLFGYNRNNILRCRECNIVYSNRLRSRNLNRVNDYDNIEYERRADRDRERDRERGMLNQIYNELLHQNNLLQSMRIDISNIWNRINTINRSNTNDEYLTSRYQQSRNNTTNHPTSHPANHPTNHTTNHPANHPTNHNQNRTSNARININGIPYIVENMQHFNFRPSTLSNNLIDSFMNIMDFQSNVPVIPTREQIACATREIQFSEIENPINTTCPISLETFQETDIITQILHCNHNFNTRQLNIWFQSNVRCPMCRYDIREYHNDSNVPLERQTQTQTQTQTQNQTQSQRQNNNQRERQNRQSSERSDNDNNLHRRTNQTSRRLYSNTPTIESNFNSITNSLSTLAMETINDLFERNNNNFEENGESRFMFDPSNNILLFETIVNNTNRFQRRNSGSSSNSENSESRNIV